MLDAFTTASNSEHFVPIHTEESMCILHSLLYCDGNPASKGDDKEHKKGFRNKV